MYGIAGFAQSPNLADAGWWGFAIAVMLSMLRIPGASWPVRTVATIEAVPKLVKGPCLLNVVRAGKTPEIEFVEAERMGYKLAIVPGLLIKSVVAICEQMLAELKATRRHPVPVKEITVRETFQVFGADQWDELRHRFREPLAKREAAE